MRSVFAAALLSFLAVTAAHASPQEEAAAAPRDCFASTNWQGWSAAESGDVLYLRVRQNDIYRVDLTPGTQVRDRAGRFLVNRQRGSAWVCSPLDLDLTLADNFGFERPLIATALRKLTAEEAAAIPEDDQP